MICVNTRALQAPLTGVQRYTSSMLHLIGSDMIELYPKEHLGQVSGHLWEQFVVPIKSKNRPLWSPANTGPIGYSNQVVTIHDASVLDHPEWFEKKFSTWYQYLLPRLIRSVRSVITDSDFSKERILHHVGVSPEKIRVTPLGIDTIFQSAEVEFSKEELMRTIGVDQEYVLCVGSIEPRKNLVNLIDAWMLVPSQVRCGYLLLVVGGKGHAFRDLQINSIPEDVKFIGRVDDVMLPALYRYATIFAYPSLYEGFGLPVLEAMACGTPVLTSNTSSLPEVVGKAALLIDPTNKESIADGLSSLLTDIKLRSIYRDLGWEHSKLFKWERTAAMTSEVFLSAFL